MTDSEIISLLNEYNFKEKEISAILKDLKTRDFESVLEFAEQHRADRRVDRERTEALKVARAYGDELRREEELKQRYKEMVLKKIKANREEQARKAEIAEQPHTVEKTAQIKADVKVKAILNEKEEMILGFDKDATVQDLYNKLLEKLAVSKVEIRKFGHSSSIGASDRGLVEEFNAKAIMIDVIY